MKREDFIGTYKACIKAYCSNLYTAGIMGDDKMFNEITAEIIKIIDNVVDVVEKFPKSKSV